MERRTWLRPMRIPRIRRRLAPGAVPGTISAVPESEATRISVFTFDGDEVSEQHLDSIEQLPTWDGRIAWINVDGLGDGQTIEALGQRFNLHRLALEDAVNVHQRPKVEAYGDHLFIVLRMMTWNDGIHSEQISLFLGRDFVLTLQERPGDCLTPVRERIRNGYGRIRTSNAAYLAYAIIDAIVDSYFPAVDRYGDKLEELEALVDSDIHADASSDMHGLRSDLLLLRRAIRPLREELGKLTPVHCQLLDDSTEFYFRDCRDHVAQLMDLLDTYREMVNSLRDVHLAMISNRMNEVMKVLTIIATIFIPLSFIAGLYGMNFKTRFPWNMPELSQPYGYLGVLALMAAVACGQLAFFWMKGWIGNRAERRTSSDEPN